VSVVDHKDVEYDAFVSYSHHGDEPATAAKVKSGLQCFARPWYKPRVLRVFLDTANLAATPELWDSIVGALRRSKWFILMASTHAASSCWVNREVEWWLQNKGGERLLVVLVDGAPRWDHSRGRFDREITTAATSALLDICNKEPLWVDLTVSDKNQLNTLNTKLDNHLPVLAAAIHGKLPEDMKGEHVRQRKRTRRLVVAVLISMMILVVTATVGAVVAVVQRENAINQRQLTLSQKLAAQSALLERKQPDA